MEIIAFDRKLDRSPFSCGEPDLDEWLKVQAGQQERANNTRTFLAVEELKVIGYYATTAYRLGLDEVAAMYGVGRRAYPIPAVLLARLAVDAGSQGSGVGSRLLLHALRQVATASRYVGFEVLVVHAINRDAVTFYAQRGFTQFEDHDLHLFLPVKNLLTTLEALSTVRLSDVQWNLCPEGGKLTMSEAKSARINLRLDPEALETIRAAASVQQQDLTSFVLGAAMERARAVLAEDRLLRLTPHEVNQLEQALDSESEVVPQLRAFIRRISEGSEAVSS